MKFLRRLIDPGLLFLLISWGGWLYLTGGKSEDIEYIFTVFSNHIYYSLLTINVFSIVLFGLLSLAVLFREWETGLYRLKSTAEVAYLYTGLFILIGTFRWLLLSGGGRLADPVWITFVLLWLMFGSWFWLSRATEGVPFARIALGIYGVLILFMFPLGATAFSYGALNYIPVGNLPLKGEILITGIVIFALFYLRFYVRISQKYAGVTSNN